MAVTPDFSSQYNRLVEAEKAKVKTLENKFAEKMKENNASQSPFSNILTDSSFKKEANIAW